MKGNGQLEDIFTDTNSVEHDRVFNPYATGTQVNAYHHSKWEDKTPAQQIEGVDARTDMSDGRQDCDIGDNTLKTEIMKKQSEQQRW